ncbi:cell division protein FtsQ [Postechiella marina]|uniref:Cell division protein FtsQ n=1 Tax=Postechiella marina TaxID=943941 RepID=A0ABP8CE91_9FLAO
MFVLLGLVVFLFAFSSKKNAARKLADVDVQFFGDDNLFISHQTVSKLLIQNQEDVKNVPKETLDLRSIESALNSNPMIKTAQVYLTVNGVLKADIEQKRPIARVRTNASYYIDEDGLYMPLSSNYSARVPLVTGYIEKNDLKNVFTVARKIEKDDFLKTNVIEINQSTAGVISLKLRQCKFIVQLGSVNFLDKKINNLKVFYQKHLKEKTLNAYSKVNLQFDNQVVCTKT